jgi:electron transfer DM13
MKRKTLIYGLVIIAAIAAWAAFRPDRLFVNAKVNESLPIAPTSNGTETVLASGTFHSVAHNSAGTASIYQLADGKRVLRFTNFETSNGPDVRVYLVAANDAADSDTVKKAGFREIAPLKGNIGDQNYDLPSDVELTKYRAVTIWCKRFGVNFATAPLSSAESSPATAQVLASGSFHDVAHKGAGQAMIYQLAGGKRVLRFTNFETSNGPDVRVYLVATKDARDSETVKKAGFVELGALKGNIGDQNYELSSDLDLNKYRAVTIWCQRFGVNFATAPLSTAGSPMAAMK